MKLLIETLLLVLSSAKLCLSQYYQGGQWTGATKFNPQYYNLYPGRYQNMIPHQSGMANAYSNQFRSASQDSDSIMKSAMVPLNSVVSSGPAQPVLMPSFFSLAQPPSTRQRSAVSDAASTNKKSNCTTGCNAARSASEEETKMDLQNPPNFQISQTPPNEKQQSCECLCTRELMYSLLPYLSFGRYLSPSAVQQYPQSSYNQQLQNAYQQLQKAYQQYKNYYDQSQTARQSNPANGHYDPTSYIAANAHPYPNYSYQQPNYQTGYYS